MSSSALYLQCLFAQSCHPSDAFSRLPSASTGSPQLLQKLLNLVATTRGHRQKQTMLNTANPILCDLDHAQNSFDGRAARLLWWTLQARRGVYEYSSLNLAASCVHSTVPLCVSFPRHLQMSLKAVVILAARYSRTSSISEC